jgi:hypothetical protein
MRKVVFVIIVLMLSMLISSCAAKLTTIRPTLITTITVENIAVGEKIELLRDDNDETDWLMDDLIFQMEQFFIAAGECGEGEEHLYSARYFMGEQLELDVIINTDGSVCKNGRRYVQKEDSGPLDRSVDLEQWEECFAIHKAQ